MNFKLLRFLLIILSTSTVFHAQTYKDSKANIEDRVNDLLSKMTLEEKIGQMQQNMLEKMNESVISEIKNGKVGSFLNAGDLESKAKLQKIAVEQSRLGIPLIFGRDVIHGYKTIFPIPLGQAASWNSDLVEKGSIIAAREAAEAGIHWTFAPMVGISRDPRWGRVAESCGEDPFLASKLGVALVKGFQGNDLSSENTIAACIKHYVGYGATEGGKDYNTTLIPERELRDIYLKPFQASIKAGAATLMSAFNDLNGVPTSANSFTLKTVLRDEWNFDGFVISDWGAVSDLINHGIAKDSSEAALKAANAGVNMEMVSRNFTKNLSQHIADGKVEQKWVDELVAGILRVKFRLGLFENPYTRITENLKTLSDEFKEVAKQSAIESIVILQNEDDFLPLNDKFRKIAIIGPLADSPLDQLGTWTPDGEAKNTITPLMAIKEEFGNSIEINFCKGLEKARSTETDYFKKTVETAKKSDVVLLFVGEDYLLSGETHSRAFINLPGVQEDLIKTISKTGKPIVLVIMAGRPLTFGNITKDVKSILYAWHPGTMGGQALSDIIFGKVSPSGKLPVTFPRTVGQIPLYYNHKNTGRPPAPNQLGRKIGTPENPEGFACYYLDVDYTPAYNFGFGLSYAKFEYSNLNISSNKIRMNEKLEVKITVKNTGKMEAKEIVQLYVRDIYGSVTRPIKELKAFEKINLNPDEEKEVKFTISSDDLKFHNIDMKYVAEPGDFELFVGSSSNNNDLLKTNFIIE